MGTWPTVMSAVCGCTLQYAAKGNIKHYAAKGNITSVHMTYPADWSNERKETTYKDPYQNM